MTTDRKAPCPCGSGRRYKSCCYATDRAAEDALRLSRCRERASIALDEPYAARHPAPSVEVPADASAAQRAAILARAEEPARPRLLRARTPAERKARDASRAGWRAAKSGVRPAEPANDTAVAPPAPPAPPSRAPAIVRSTTRKAPAVAPDDRRSDVLSPTLLAWVRAQPCEVGAAGCEDRGEGGVDPHHWPSTGANGLQLDVLVISACRRCHDACHDGRVSADDQDAAAGRTWARFWRLAPPALQRVVVREIGESLGA